MIVHLRISLDKIRGNQIHFCPQILNIYSQQHRAAGCKYWLVDSEIKCSHHFACCKMNVSSKSNLWKNKKKSPRPREAAPGLQTLSANDTLGDDLPDTKDIPVNFPVKPSVHVFFDIVAKLVDTWHVPKPPRLPTHRPKHLPLVVQRRLHPRISTQTGGMVLRRASTSHRLGPQFSRVRELPCYRHLPLTKKGIRANP